MWNVGPAHSVCVCSFSDAHHHRITHAGVMPASWNWPAVTDPTRVPVYVFAQPLGGSGAGGLWPGGGIRVETNWRQKQCDGVRSLGMDKTYWWCD